MSTWLANTRDVFRTRLWPVPTIAVVLALVLGVSIPGFDSAIDERLPSTVSNWIFEGDADAARSLLDAIASSLITVTALTFSLTVVTLQLASSQFSPRLLRTFTRDRFVQVTLALFLATFTYALTVLRAVRGSGEGQGGELVPRVAVTLAFILAVASVLALVLFLAHLTEQIRVETMLRNVHRDAVITMRSVLTPSASPGDDPAFVPDAPAHAQALSVDDDGFLTWVDHSGLLAIAVEEEALLLLDVHPGSFLVRGTPVGSVWLADGGRLSSEACERITDRVARCIHVGFERTSTQDVGFGLRQLVDVANKALSPGINDPTTAIHALGHISALLCDLADFDLGAALLRDEDDRIRVVLHRPDLASYVDLGISQPRRYGAADPQVLQRIFQVLLDLSHRVGPDQRSVVRDQLERLTGTVLDQSFDATEVAGFAAITRQIEGNLGSPEAHRPSSPAGTPTQ